MERGDGTFAQLSNIHSVLGEDTTILDEDVFDSTLPIRYFTYTGNGDLFFVAAQNSTQSRIWRRDGQTGDVNPLTAANGPHTLCPNRSAAATTTPVIRGMSAGGDGVVYITTTSAVWALYLDANDSWQIRSLFAAPTITCDENDVLRNSTSAEFKSVAKSDDGTLYVTTRNNIYTCLLYTSPSPRDATLSRMPSSA